MKLSKIENNTQLLCLTGSHAYGLETDTSDYDYKGVFIAEPEYYFGFKNIEQKDSGWNQASDPLTKFKFLKNTDTTIYEIRKYISLALNNNPNILEMFFLDEAHYLHITDLGRKLLEAKDIFLSKKVKHSLSGYAYSQIRKLEGHRSWLLNPPKTPPKLEDFGLSEEYQPLTKEEVNAFLEFLYILIKDRVEYLSTIDEIKAYYLNVVDIKGVLTHNVLPKEILDYLGTITRSSKDFVSLLHATQRYRAAERHWKEYQNWLKNRNPKRFEVEKKIGYDGKFASHAIRLLKMGVEALNNHCLYVNRKNIDRDELLAIKLGNVDYNTMLEQANSLFESLDAAYQTSTLRHRPDIGAANELCVELVQEFL